MKVFAYLRVSTDTQDFKQQENAINDYLRVKGLQIDEVYTDEGVSGGISYKKRRLNDLLNVMNSGDVLVVSEISRLGRSMSDLNKLVNDEMKVKNLRLIVVGMGLDIDCAKLKAIDEMILFAFSFASQIEKEMIQERTRNALDARKKLIEEHGYFVSKSGRRCEKLGGGAISNESRQRACCTKKLKAKMDETNQQFAKYVNMYERRNGIILNNNSPKEYFEEISNELNMLGCKTKTGLEYTRVRVRALWVRMKGRENIDNTND